MIANLLVNFELFGSRVRIVGEWHKRRRAVVDSIGDTKREVVKVCYCGSKRGREDDGVNVLVR